MSQTAAPSTPTFAISDLAREFGITPRTIRFWEDQGILSPEREGSKRVFTRRDRARLKMALRGKRLGLSLAEIKDLIGMYASTEDETPQLARMPARHGKAPRRTGAAARGHRGDAGRDCASSRASAKRNWTRRECPAEYFLTS